MWQYNRVCFWIIASLANSGESRQQYLHFCISVFFFFGISVLPTASQLDLQRAKYPKKCECCLFWGAICSKNQTSKTALQATGNTVNRLQRNGIWVVQWKRDRGSTITLTSIIAGNLDWLTHGLKSFTQLRKSLNWCHQFGICLDSVSNFWSSRSWKDVH